METTIRLLPSKLQIVTLALASLWLLPPAVAQQTPDAKLAAQLAAFLKRFPASDLDQDGKLTRDEVREFNRQRRQPPENARARERGRPTPTAADVPYGSHPKQRFDVWAVPEAKTPTPLVIFIHGGGFRGGDKQAFNPATIAAYHAQGIAFASMNYRLSDVGPYPLMMEDCARGLQTIRHRAGQWNLDPTRIGCYGGSAGAGISLWLAFHDDLALPDSQDPIARQSTRITAAGATGGQSTYDLRTFRRWFGVPNLPPHPALIPFYGIQQEEDWQSTRVIALMEAASPINHLSPDDTAPVYMTYNRGDVPVTRETEAGVWVHHYRLGLKLQEAMQAIGKECHVSARRQDRGGDDRTPPQYPDMTAFFVAKLKGQSATDQGPK